MSTTIDEKVVEMRFDNKQFENNVRTSLSTIDKLKSSLKLDGAAKGFENIDKAAKNVSFEGIAAGVEALQARFSTFGIVGMRIVENLTDSMMNLANRTVSFLTNGIVQGGITRAMNLENAHFQLQGLLKDEEAVSAVMKNVSDSVDGTAYSLDSAAKVASQLAASGMRAGDEMFTSLRAVAGVAAMTNSEYDEIGKIFTTVAGNGRLMGEQLLQLSSRGMNAAATLAEYLHISEADVREMVSEGQISFEIFATAMDNAFGEHAKKANETFTGAISNIKAALARIGAEFISPLVVQNGALVKLFNTLRERINDVKSNIGPLSDMFVNTVTTIAEKTTKYFEQLDLTNHFKIFYNGLDALKNVLKVTWSIVKPIGQAFLDIFPPKTTSQIVSFTEALKIFTSKLKLSSTASANLKTTFKGLFAILDIIKQAFSAVFKAVSPLAGGLDDLGGGILSITASWGEWLVQLDQTIEKNDIFNKAIRGVIDFVKKAAIAVKDFAREVKEKFNLPDFDTVKESVKDFLKTVKGKIETTGFKSFKSLLDRIKDRMSKVGNAAASMKDGFVKALDSMSEALSKYKFIEILQSLWDVLKTIIGGIGEGVGTLLGTIVDKLGDSDFNGLLDIINSISLSAIAFGIAEVMETIAKPLRPFSGVISNVKISLQELRVCLAEYQAQLKAKTLMTIAGAIAILAASVIALSLVDSDKLNLSIGAITMLFADLMSSMAIFTQVSKTSTNLIKASVAMMVLSVGVAIMAGAMKKLANLDWNGVAKGLVGVAGMAAVLVASVKVLSLGGGTIILGASSLIVLAAAVNILALACKSLSGLSWEELSIGLAGVGGLLAEITAFLKLAKFNSKTTSTATGIVILSAAMKILASVCKDFGNMSLEEISKGLASVGVLLTEIALFTRITGNAKHVMSTGTSLVIIAASMKIFASVVSDFGTMSWEKIGKGLTAMGGALAEVAIASKLMPKNMVSIGTGLVIVGAALEIIANVMSKFSNLSWESIGKGLVTIGGALAELTIALKLMNGTLAGSAAMLVAASALAILTPVLKSLGTMTWESIAKGLVSIAGAFAVLGVAGAVLSPIVPAILSLSGAFALMGVGLLAAGAGLLALEAAFTGLATVGVAGASAIVSALTIIITGVANLIPVVIAKIGEGIIAFCQVIADGAPVFKEAVLALIDVLVECVPAFADGILKLTAEVLTALAEYTPQIVDSLLKILIGILESISDNLPILIKAAVDVLMAFFSGIADALSGIDTAVLLKGIVGIGLLSAIIFALSTVASFVPGAMIGVLGMGVIIAELALVLAAIGALVQIPGLSWLIGEGGKLLEGIGTAIGSFIGGIVGGFMSGISSQFPKIGSDLSDFMTNLKPFIEGASKIKSSAMDGVKALGEAILILTAADILQGLTSWLTGGSSITDFGAELAAFGPYFNKYYQSVKGIDGSVVESSANAAKTLAEMADILPNSGGVVGWFAGENSLATFAEELVKFGPKLKKYAESVKGLDADVVVNSANAAKALAEMASNLPNSGGVAGWFMGENNLSSFAEELAEFGPVLKEYADSVTGLNANVVVNSANAAKALAEMISELPNQGGAVSWFIGDNTLSVFAEELVKFGPKLKRYSDGVDGLNADVVINSANAAKALSELAANLPNNGGVIGWFTGNNTLSGFAEELAEFGPVLKEYADSVDGLKPSVVINSANAAKALAELATNLPENGGLISWFTGDNDIGSFGKSLVSFGEKFAKYSDYMKNVDTSILTATTSAANSIVELQNSLPKSGGWFSDNAALSDFGEDMASFGSYFRKYYDRVSNVDVSQLSSVISQTNNLVTMAKGMTELDTSGMKNFGSSLADLGRTGINEFVGAFSNSASSVANAASDMLTAFISEIDSEQGDFYKSGSTLSAKLIAGIKVKESNAVKTVTNILISCLKAIEKRYAEFRSRAQECMNEVITGVKTKNEDLNTTFESILYGVTTVIKDYRAEFYSAGSYLIDGFVNGISDNSENGLNAIAQFGYGVLETFKDILDINSPSKKFSEFGKYTGEGFIVGINEYSDKITKTTGNLGGSILSSFQNVISKLSDVMNSGIDYEPTIRPVIDLSGVKSGTRLVNDVVDKCTDFNISASGKLAYSVADGVNTSLLYKQAYDNTLLDALDKLSLNKDKNVTYNFNQTNNSPKSLSRYEIYRQSKNLLATIREVK